MDRTQIVKSPPLFLFAGLVLLLFAGTVGIVTAHDDSPAVMTRPTTPSSSTTTSSTTTSTTSSTTTTAPPTMTTTAPPVVPATDPPVEPAPEPAPAAPGPVSGADSWPSQAWWDAIATCESGNTNAWRTGWFGIEAGYPIGGLSYDEQLAWARRIFAESGPSAWGCWATVGGPY